MSEPLSAPFPYFGGKSRAADLVWSRFGVVDNYVEPFAGSAAMLLAAPEGKRIETINDADGMIANFWRAVASDPEAVAHHADWPCNEADLFARHHVAEQRERRRIDDVDRHRLPDQPRVAVEDDDVIRPRPPRQLHRARLLLRRP